MRAWLKGGLIGIAAALVLMIISVVFNLDFLQGFLAKISFWFSAPFTYLYQLLGLAGTGENYGLLVIFIFFGLVLELFVLGAIIGLIIGKIKSKSLPENN